MSLLLLMLAQFSAVARKDPITLERQAAFMVEDQGNTLALVCLVDKHELTVAFTPRYYQGPTKYVPLWSAQADSRFGLQGKPEANAWFFEESRLTYAGAQQNVWNSVTAKAKFIDRLAADQEFNIRYEAAPGDVRTVTISYTLDLGELRQFLRMCGAPKVLAQLSKMKSIAAP